MSKKRLVELYAPGERVEITFDGETWFPVIVARHEPPGVWVLSGSGALWFVTNSRHIRHGEAAP